MRWKYFSRRTRSLSSSSTSTTKFHASEFFFGDSLCCASWKITSRHLDMVYKISFYISHIIADWQRATTTTTTKKNKKKKKNLNYPLLLCATREYLARRIVSPSLRIIAKRVHVDVFYSCSCSVANHQYVYCVELRCMCVILRLSLVFSTKRRRTHNTMCPFRLFFFNNGMTTSNQSLGKLNCANW